MPDLQPILAQLRKARRRLLAVADCVPAERWLTCPRSGAWSAAEVVAHLIVVELSITGSAVRHSAKPPKQFPVWKRMRLPLWLAEWRGLRFRSPVPLDSSLLMEKEAMLAGLRGVRQRTLAFLEQTQERDWSRWRWPHPLFGSLNFYDWFRVMAYHELRHAKQIQEIVSLMQNGTYLHSANSL